jgi:polysaccharide pyruvyl transferase WcaK-like protein
MTQTTEAQSFFSLKTQFENVGDALINREMVRLAAANGRAHVDLSRCPERFRRTVKLEDNAKVYHGFGSLCRSMITHRLQGKRCYYFLSPGGYVGEVGWKEMPSKLLNTFVLLAFVLIGIRICLVGVSYERLGSRNIRLQALRSKLLYRHFLRDRASLAYAQQSGFKTSGLMPDLAFNIFSHAAQNKQSLKPADVKRVAFSFRTDQYEHQKEQVIATAKACLALLPERISVLLMVQVERDRPGMQALKTALESEGILDVTFVEHPHSIEDCISAYNTSDLIISNRLHALLMAGSVTGHLLAVTGDGKNKKIEGVLEELGQPDVKLAAGETAQQTIQPLLETALDFYVDGQVLHRQLQKGFREFLT